VPEARSSGTAGSNDGVRVLVAGASGFAGALAAYLVWRHPAFELCAVTARAEAGQSLSELYPRYRVPLVLEQFDVARHGDVDAAIVAYPHAAAAPVVAALRERGVRVVDLSADFRLRDLATYERWYEPHPAPDLLSDVAYGLTELHRDEIADAAIVANPGCYPTATVLGLAPLARAGLLADVVIDAKQGISGAGRAPSAETHLSQAGENVTPYKVAGHRHAPEIEEQLALLGADLRVQFTPHLVPLDQGELVSCYVTTTRPVSANELGALYEDAYADEQFIELADAPPGVREVRETNYCRIHALVHEHTGKVLVFAALDNLWKGTSSQAVQNLNLMFGVPESMGLL
jgi:N-acetyl-gamma-glutamyl-phosphate reductase